MRVLVGRMVESGGAVVAYYYCNTDEDPPKRPAPVHEVSPPGMKKMVKKMKKHKEIDNPFALAWSMKKKGYKSHYDSYVARHAELSESTGSMTPMLSPSEHALAWRVLARLSEARRDPDLIRELRNRLLLNEQPKQGD